MFVWLVKGYKQKYLLTNGINSFVTQILLQFIFELTKHCTKYYNVESKNKLLETWTDGIGASFYAVTAKVEWPDIWTAQDF